LKSTIWIFSLEPIETRYTAQWHSHVPALLKTKQVIKGWDYERTN